MASSQKFDGYFQPFTNLVLLPVAVLLSAWVITNFVSHVDLDQIMIFDINPNVRQNNGCVVANSALSRSKLKQQFQKRHR